MLLTRCPECDTTFRVTDETLKKASGQVRCGRCASVFNAYAELQGAGSKPLEAGPRGQARQPPPATKAPEPPKPTPGAAGPEAKRAASDSVAGATTVPTAVDADANLAPDDAASEQEALDRRAITATEVDRVLTDDSAESVPYVWLQPEPPPRGPVSRRPGSPAAARSSRRRRRCGG